MSLVSSEDRKRQLSRFAMRLRELVWKAANAADPAWALANGLPEDEYSPEVGPIAEKILRMGRKPSPQEVEEISRAAFHQYLRGEGIMRESMNDDGFGVMARRITDEWDSLEPPEPFDS